MLVPVLGRTTSVFREATNIMLGKQTMFFRYVTILDFEDASHDLGAQYDFLLFLIH